MTRRRHRETLDAMRYSTLALLAIALAACGDDNSTAGSVDADTRDPAKAHELVDCDVASWRTVYPPFPDGQQCERACEAAVAHPGPQCGGCPSTFDYAGLDGCCVYDGINPAQFVECP